MLELRSRSSFLLREFPLVRPLVVPDCSFAAGFAGCDLNWIVSASGRKSAFILELPKRLSPKAVDVGTGNPDSRIPS